MRVVNQQGINSDDFQLFKSFTQKYYGGHKRSPTSIAWNKSGDKFATAQNYVKLWDFDAYGIQKLQQMKSHQNTVDQIKFFSNVMLGSLSKQLFKLWDVRQSNLKSIKSQKKGKSDFISFAFTNQLSQQQSASSADPNLLYTLLTKDNTLLVYDIRNTSTPINSVNVKNVLSNLNSSIQLSKIVYDRSNSILFAVGGENSTGQILMFNASENYDLIPEGIIDCHCSKINDIAVDPTNSYIATVSEDSLTQIHQLPEVICQKAYSNKFDANIKCADFSHDGKYLAVASQGQTIDIFNAKYGGWAFKLKLYNDCKALAWNPKKLVLCYISSYEQKKKSVQKAQQTYINIFSANITI